MAYSKVPTVKVKSIPLPKAPKTVKVPDSFASEVRMESRRLTGVTPKLVGAYQERPARFLPKASLQGMAGRK